MLGRWEQQGVKTLPLLSSPLSITQLLPGSQPRGQRNQDPWATKGPSQASSSVPEPKASLAGRDCPLDKTPEHPRDLRWEGLERRIKTLSTQTHTHTYSQRHTQIIWGLVWHCCHGAVKGKDETLWHTETSHTYTCTSARAHTFGTTQLHTRKVWISIFFIFHFPHFPTHCTFLLKLHKTGCSCTQRPDKTCSTKHHCFSVSFLVEKWVGMLALPLYKVWQSSWTVLCRIISLTAISHPAYSSVTTLSLQLSLLCTSPTIYISVLVLQPHVHIMCFLLTGHQYLLSDYSWWGESMEQHVVI